MNVSNKQQGEPGETQDTEELSEAEIKFKVDFIAKEQDLSEEQVEKFVEILTAWQSTDVLKEKICTKKDLEKRTNQQEMIKRFDIEFEADSKQGSEETVAKQIAGLKERIQKAREEGNNSLADRLEGMSEEKIEMYNNNISSNMVERLRNGKADTNNFWLRFNPDFDIDSQGILTTENSFTYEYSSIPFLINKKFNGAWRDACNDRIPEIIRVLKIRDGRLKGERRIDSDEYELMEETLKQIIVELYDKHKIPPYLLTK